MLAAAAALLGSDAVVAVLLVPLPVLLREVAEGRAHLARKLPLLVVADLLLRPKALVVAQVPPQPVLLHPWLLPQVVVESGVTPHLQGRPSFSAAMAKNSPPTVQPTCERAPSTRSPPKGQTYPSP